MHCVALPLPSCNVPPHRCPCRERLVAASCLELLLARQAPQAAGALEALCTAGQSQRVARVAAAVLVDAADGGAAEAMAQAVALMWQHAQTALLCDMALAAMGQGWTDAAAQVMCGALQQGSSDAAAGVLAAVVARGAAAAAAQLAARVAMAFNFSPAATEVREAAKGVVRGRGMCMHTAPHACFLTLQALGGALVTLVRSGAAPAAAAVADVLLQEGHDDLMRDVASHLSAAGRREELSQLAAAAAGAAGRTRSWAPPVELSRLLDAALTGAGPSRESAQEEGG